MYDKALPAPLRIAQAIGITTSIFAASFGFTTSFLLIPRLLESPTPLLSRQWRKMFYRGMKTVVPLTITSSISYLYLSYRFYSGHSKIFRGEWQFNALAGLLMAGSVGYTAVVMEETNRKLMIKAEEMEGLGAREVVAEGQETVHGLVDWWGILNLGRAAIFGLASLTGTYAAFG